MRKQAYIFSTVMHAGILLLMWADWSFSFQEFDKTNTPVIMVDLKKVQIADKTNLPPKVKKTPKPTVTPAAPKTDKTPATKTTVAPKPAEPVKPKEHPKPKDSVKAALPPKRDEKKTQPKKKPETVKKPTPPNTAKPDKKAAQSDLKSLLASVDRIKKPARPSSQTTEAPATGQEVQDGIEGGTGGSLMQPLTISEKDLIVNKLRGCWNVDAGATGIDDMVIEVRAYVARDGRVKDVKILNMKNDASFRSVAESARRAVYICDALGDESPFKLLADTRKESYDAWKEIFVRFRPLDGGVF